MFSPQKTSKHDLRQRKHFLRAEILDPDFLISPCSWLRNIQECKHAHSPQFPHRTSSLPELKLYSVSRYIIQCTRVGLCLWWDKLIHHRWTDMDVEYGAMKYTSPFSGFWRKSHELTAILSVDVNKGKSVSLFHGGSHTDRKQPGHCYQNKSSLIIYNYI